MYSKRIIRVRGAGPGAGVMIHWLEGSNDDVFFMQNKKKGVFKKRNQNWACNWSMRRSGF